MSGFVSELMVFAGFATDEAYTLPFRVVICGLAAVGVILTPIYLLSMLREIFFGKEKAELVDTPTWWMPSPVRCTSSVVCWYRSSASACT